GAVVAAAGLADTRDLVELSLRDRGRCFLRRRPDGGGAIRAHVGVLALQTRVPALTDRLGLRGVELRRVLADGDLTLREVGSRRREREAAVVQRERAIDRGV